MDIEKVAFKDYQDKVIKEETILGKQYNVHHMNEIRLDFTDGTKLTLRDTVYEDMEYSPTNHYELFTNKDLADYYLIFNSFFEESDFILFDKANGDTAHVFDDYPFVSPDRNMTVSLKAPITYQEGIAVMEITRFKEATFRFLVNAEFINWNLPNDKHIYWLSDREFMLKVRPVGKAYSNEEGISFFLFEI